MTRDRSFLHRLPGYAGQGIMIAFSTFWTYWGTAEMYHEGWWGAWHNRLPYLAIIAVSLLPTLVAITWPLAGGVLISALGAASILLFGVNTPFFGIVAVAIGLLFAADGILCRRSAPDDAPAIPWWRHNLPYLLALGLPLIVLIVVSTRMLPIVLTRVDDGDRGAQLIEGNGVSLVWAPEGPGWNWRQSWGGYPSWQSIALYGVPPIGLGDKSGYGRQATGMVYAGAQEMVSTNLCRYLRADGLGLMDEPQDVWRMPTSDEVVRSLVRHGENAGCRWAGEPPVRAECDVLPDKESPLWATDHAAIYYWTADQESDALGIYVSYNGWVNATFKAGGNPRHSYRCVRDP
ncbi:MAG: hypothetical protein PVG11_01210 [Anaerolineae bacterium]|jgi:hypothetical protein